MVVGLQRDRNKTILALAGPIVVAMLAQTLLNVVDTIFVGRLDPAVAIPGQAGLGLAILVLWTLGGSFAAVGIGTQVIAARHHGGGDDPSTGAALVNGLLVAVVAALAITLAGWPLIPTLFEFLTNQDSVRELGIPYTKIRLLGLGAFVVIMTYKGFFDGIGAPGVHLAVALLMNLLNIALNALLVFGWGPFPQMGVGGAAIASLAATFAAVIAMIAWSLRPSFQARFGPYSLKKFSAATCGRIVALSAPAAAAVLFVMAGLLATFKVVDLTDQAAMAAAVQAAAGHNFAAQGLPDWLLSNTDWAARVFVDDWSRTLAISRPPLFMTGAKLIIDIMGICVVASIAFGQATATLVANALGGDRRDLAWAYGWDSLKLGLAFFTLISLAIVFYPTFFLRILTTEADVIAVTVPSLRLMGANLLFVAMAVILCQAHFGAGRAAFVMLAVVSHAIALPLLAYLFAVVFGGGFMGVWFAVASTIISLSVVLALHFRKIANA